jgi:predicted nucleic acid-binding protein
MNAMPGGDFLDANVILYAFDDDLAKRAVAEDILESADAANTCISFQVLQEVLNVLSRRTEASSTELATLPVLEAILLPLCRLHPSEALYRRALSLRQRYQFSFFDSLIIAAALEAGCERLLSEDMQHGQRIEGLLIENPFHA